MSSPSPWLVVARSVALAAVVIGLAVDVGWAQKNKKKRAPRPTFPAYTDVSDAGPDHGVQGEYVGTIKGANGDMEIAVQVIARGDGKFDAVLYEGGLPGAGWSREKPRHLLSLYQTKGGDGSKAYLFQGEGTEYRVAVLPDGGMGVKNSGGQVVGRLKKVERTSPTLGAKAPAGAIVLFDGTNLDAFTGGGLTDDGLLAVGAAGEERQEAITKREFGDFKLHLEFQSPYMPTAEGQQRGNSGVYVQNRYEIQVLDSFGLNGENNECGGIYQQSQPAVNMCLPPLSWQTYDIDFTAPKFDAAGKKTANARITLLHNGVAIYDGLELSNVTPGGIATEGATGPIKLQDHHNPVRFRNIWIVEKN